MTLPTSTSAPAASSALGRARGRARAGLLRLAKLAVLVAVNAWALWATLAIWWSNLPWPWLRGLAAACFVLAVLALQTTAPWPRKQPKVETAPPAARSPRVVWRIAAVAGLCTLVVLWFLLTPPSNTRNWRPDVAVLPWAESDGQRVTLHNVRNVEYRSANDYTVRYQDLTVDLEGMCRVDLLLSYFSSPLICHTMMTFGFDDGQYVCISIEARKEQGETYLPRKGFFHQYELVYVVAGERDLVGQRTRQRGEQVYLYRLQAPMDIARAVFRDYLVQINRLREHPQWYNTAASNCTTRIRVHAEPYTGSDWDWPLLFNGRIDQMAYRHGVLDQSLPFAELRQRSLINDKANAAGAAADFSRAIRGEKPPMNTDEEG